MYIDPISRQTFIYATPISCANNPQNVIALDAETNEHYVLTSKFVLRATPMRFEPKQVQSAISPITFTAEDFGIYTNAELTNLWNPVLFAKHSGTTLRLWDKPSGMTF